MESNHKEESTQKTDGSIDELSPEPSKLALFDFDGTLTRHDSFKAFMTGSLSPLSLNLYKLSTIFSLLRELAKYEKPGFWRDALFKRAFKGYTADEFRTVVLAFVNTSKENIFFRDAMAKLNEHKSLNHQVIIVSANIDLIIEPFAEALGCQYIATKSEVKDNLLTGRMTTPSCHGKQKVTRIKDMIDVKDFDYIYAYGDSSGDLEMLKMATESHFRLFKK